MTETKCNREWCQNPAAFRYQWNDHYPEVEACRFHAERAAKRAQSQGWKLVLTPLPGTIVIEEVRD